ncbi:DUF111 family protein [Marinilabiliaceae bacterium JC017]|nr:DUF111 family protein [Marinilabiliaceae bacterium JC017]
MNLYINPSGGIAGDMFAAALISAGANEKTMLNGLLIAANKIGHSSFSTVLTDDGSTRLNIVIDHFQAHLSAHAARHYLKEIFAELNMESAYREFGFKALQILIEAEEKAHKECGFLTDHLQKRQHDCKYHQHFHTPPKDQRDDTYLHEAQDILIDITGAALGLQLLGITPRAILLNAVSLGGGTINFSHGHLSVPAPAVKNIMIKYKIPVVMGPVDSELCTPTGAAILAALGANSLGVAPVTAQMKGRSRGGKDLPIPPLEILC